MKKILLFIILLLITLTGCFKPVVYDADDVEWWFEYYTEVDNRTWSPNYNCKDFAKDAVKEWEEDFGNSQLVVACTSDHCFNALLVGNYKELDGWVFINPMSGLQVEVGEYPYEFPLYVDVGFDQPSPTIGIVFWE